MYISCSLENGSGEEQTLTIQNGVEVIKVSVNEDTNGVTIETSSGETLHASAVVVTVPLGVLKANTIQFEPALPKDKLEAIANCGMFFIQAYHFLSVRLIFQKQFLNNSS